MSAITNLVDAYAAGRLTHSGLIEALARFNYHAPNLPPATGNEAEQMDAPFGLPYPQENTWQELDVLTATARLSLADRTAIFTRSRELRGAPVR